MARPTAQYQADLNLWTNRHNGVRSEPRRTITIHTDESAYDYAAKRVRDWGWTAKRLAEYNREPGVRGSYHLGVDNDGHVVRQVNDRGGTWSVGNRGNNEGIHICAAGTTAFWTREQWMAKPKLLDKLAEVTAHEAAFHGIPVRKIDHNQTRAGSWGINGHWDYSKAYGGSTHWDPGGYPDTSGGFPWDHFIDLVKKHSRKFTNTPTPAPQIKETPDMNEEDRKLIRETNENLKFVRDQLAGIGGGGGWPQGGDRTLYDLVAAIAEKQGIPNTFDTLAQDETTEERDDHED